MKKTAYSLAFALIFMSQSAFSSTYYYLGCVTTNNDVQFAKTAPSKLYTFMRSSTENSTYIDYQWTGYRKLFVVDYEFTNQSDAEAFCLSLVNQCKAEGKDFTGSFVAYGGIRYYEDIYVNIKDEKKAEDSGYKSCEFLAGYAAGRNRQ